MKTVFSPCEVPWSANGELTLIHKETDLEPECMVITEGSRVCPFNGHLNGYRLEVIFRKCYFARSEPHHDSADVENLGYEVERKLVAGNDIRLNGDQFLETWKSTGFCPDSNFYSTGESEWLNKIGHKYAKGMKHYLLHGRDGHIEVVAEDFEWVLRAGGGGFFREEVINSPAFIGSENKKD